MPTRQALENFTVKRRYHTEREVELLMHGEDNTIVAFGDEPFSLR
jgi:hypothetical protein